MYRILVVDNEAYVVESVMFYLENQADLDVELHGCFGASEACELMARMRIDVLISDIRMPEMDGLQLQKIVVDNWPHCRTLFLTGYPDFEYIQQAMRGGACDYLLKTEGRDAIVSAVKKIVARLDEQNAREVEDAKRTHLEGLATSMREMFFSSLLYDSKSNEEIRNAFASLETCLDASRPVLVCIARSDEGLAQSAWKENASMVGVKQMIEHAMEAHYRCLGLMYHQGWLAWLLQPRKDDPASWRYAGLYLNETIESLQQKCKLLMDVTISFAIAADVCSWEEVCRKRQCLENLLYSHIGQEAILIESSQKSSSSEPENKLDEELERMEYLAACLETSNRQEFYHTFDRLIRVSETISGDKKTRLRLEIVGRLAVMITAQLNRWDFWGVLESQVDLSPLYGRLWTMPFSEAVSHLARIADALFDIKAQRNIATDESMVSRLHWIIDQNLGGDLSLTRLGELLGMNPYYMARCYQQTTGEKLTSYIANVRFERARELIAGGGMIHRDIAKVIGFGSEQAFNRFFKKMSGMAPRDWREKMQK